MSAILGISAYYHDSAACLVLDGRIVAAAQEERFTRKKHDERFPTCAIAYCLSAAGIKTADLDHVAFYDKPLAKFDRLLETYLAFAPRGFTSFVRAMPVWLRQKLHLTRELDRELGRMFKKPFIFAEHHESHAASAFYPSPFEEAAILTMDGVGEWATASIGIGRGNRVELIEELVFPHSLGLLYSAFTHFAGFKVNSGEYKLMGLAPYGRPRYLQMMKEKLIDLRPDGSFRLDLSYFDYCTGLRMTSRKLERLIGAPARAPESPITEREMDIAASIQALTEEIMIAMARHACAITKTDRLCLAGGVALNCVGNRKILDDGACKEMWIQPAAGDAGGALGVALLVWHQLLGKSREPLAGDAQCGSLLGPDVDAESLGDELAAVGARHYLLENDQEVCKRVAAELASGKVVGWMQGRMEFGPRALGARSILADPRAPGMQSRLNLAIKYRESFRPFAPSVLVERAREYFDLPAGTTSPYMLLVAPVATAMRREVDEEGLQGFARLHAERSTIPAVTHVDGTARLQTVDAARHGIYRNLLEEFAAQTDCPVLINTSFNVRGEPIVCTVADAYRCFMATEMDVLSIGRALLLKADQPPMPAARAAQHVGSFELD